MLRILTVVLFFAAAAPALAAPRTAPPPPSGTVVHLFGPQGVWAKIAPVVGGTPAAAPGVVASSAAPAPASAAPAPAGAGPAEQNYPEPTLGAVLHQMFVTGDPNAGPGFAQGRKTD